MVKLIDSPLNDGLLEYGVVETKRNDETRKKEGEVFTATGQLFFNFQSIHAKFDVYQVGSLSSVDIKVKVYFVYNLQKSHKIKIENELFEIEAMDVGASKKYIYLFLRKVGEWNGNNFIQTT